MSDFKIVTEGLEFPEGPVWCSDGSVIVVEIRRRTLTRVKPDGSKEVIAECGGGPNGAAVGPDGCVYICNNGGFEWHQAKAGGWFPAGKPDDYTGGSIQRVDPRTGKVDTLYTECYGRPLIGPNDLVFDSAGGFWFTDHGKEHMKRQDVTGIYYAAIDGSRITEPAFEFRGGPNGIGLSPDEKRLYMAESYSRTVFYWDLKEPGELVMNPETAHGGTALAVVKDCVGIDSLAVDAAGSVCVGTIGAGKGGITIVTPSGEQRYLDMGDMFTTNICFGGADLRTAYITRSLSGTLAAMPWESAGLKLPFNL